MVINLALTLDTEEPLILKALAILLFVKITFIFKK